MLFFLPSIGLALDKSNQTILIIRDFNLDVFKDAWNRKINDLCQQCNLEKKKKNKEKKNKKKINKNNEKKKTKRISLKFFHLSLTCFSLLIKMTY